MSFGFLLVAKEKRHLATLKPQRLTSTQKLVKYPQRGLPTLSITQ